MLDYSVLIQALGLGILILAIRLLCVRASLARVPLLLPSVAILIWLVHANLPASIAN